MFKNFLIIGLRRLKANILTSTIAILSLSLGLASGMILYRYIDFQLSYENFIGNRSLKRIISRDLYENYNEYYSQDVLYYKEAEKIRSESGIIKNIVSTSLMTLAPFRIGNDMFFENILFCDPEIFEMIPLGDSFPLFNSPDKIIIDKILADKYFPNRDFNREITFTYGNGYPLEVAGVVEIPENSHLYDKDGRFFLHIDIFESMTKGNEFKHLIYLEAEEGVTNIEIRDEIINIIKRPPEKDILEQEFIVENFKDIHLYSLSYHLSEIRPIYLIAFLSILTLGLLSVSIINSISILTTQFINRGREAGIRVVFGSLRGELIGLFISESVIITVFSTVLGLVLSELLLPLFSDLIGINLNIQYSLIYIGFISILAVVTALIIGVYPSYYLSSLNCVESLKGKRLIKLGKFKSFTIISQFFFSTLLLIASMVINNEISHLEKIETGLDSENILYIYPGYDLDKENPDNITRLKDNLLRVEGVESVSHSSFLPFMGGPLEEVLYDGTGITDYIFSTDREYFETLGIELINGEFIQGSVIAMESVLVDRELYIGDYIEVDGVEFQISGVAKDYLTDTALNYYFKPRYHLIDSKKLYFQAIKFDGVADLSEIKRIWQDVFPNRAIEISFLVNDIKEKKIPDIVKTLKRVVNLSFYISIFISLLGLCGVTLHSINEKSKEISIRKVLGGGIPEVTTYFYGKSIKNIVLGIALGAPIGLVGVSLGFAGMGYPFPIHTPVQVGVYSVLLMICVSSLIVLVLLLTSIMRNPVDALRYE